MLLDMLRIRRLEEKAAELYGLQKIRGFLHLYIGQEAVAVGVLHALRAQDNVLATYREHGHALVRGRRCPIVGVVTMDQLMLDVGDLDVEIGDSVVLLGADGTERIRAEDWAEGLGTIGYEIVCGLSKRVSRHHRAERRTLRSDSLATTHAIAAALAGLVRSGDVIVLAGEMGAGKTAFAQGFGAADCASMEEAIRTAVAMAGHARRP
eukprot:gene21644-41747_t